ncbi:MAG TPA: hypothetical protein QF624_07035 [Dehalococcoidia bacterium]|nr:hypothetical protein [Dehalococcoidia bacterium]
MNSETVRLERVLGKLPWYGNLTSLHRDHLMAEVAALMDEGSTRAGYAALLERWSVAAHSDEKWARYELLRASGIFNHDPLPDDTPPGDATPGNPAPDYPASDDPASDDPPASEPD